MTDEQRFEARLAEALRGYADEAVLPFDPDAIAQQATAAASRPSRWIRLALVATFGVAAVAAFVALAVQLGIGPTGIGGPRAITADELGTIVANDTNTPGTWGQTLDQSGEATLATPMRSTATVQLDGFIDGRTTEMCGSDAPGPTACILAWVALFETVDDARAAFAFYTAELESADGWNIPPDSRLEPTDLGDEAILYTDVQDPAVDGANLTGMYFWRQGNLVLAVVGVADMELEAVRAIADDMQARAE